MLGYYETYALDDLSVRTEAGLGDDIMVKMGRIKGYEQSQAAALGSIAAMSIGIVSLLLN